jgi:hypothetical protein
MPEFITSCVRPIAAGSYAVTLLPSCNSACTSNSAGDLRISVRSVPPALCRFRTDVAAKRSILLPLQKPKSPYQPSFPRLVPLGAEHHPESRDFPIPRRLHFEEIPSARIAAKPPLVLFRQTSFLPLFIIVKIGEVAIPGPRAQSQTESCA